MNTAFISRTGHKIRQHKEAFTIYSIITILISGGLNLAEKWIDGSYNDSKLEAIEKRIDAVEDRVDRKLEDAKREQDTRDAAQWQAIGRKQDK